jgi:quercetin dioxygenase-like cupin family protein
MKRLLVVSVAALLAASPAQAKGMKWMAAPPGLPAGAEMAVVSGDPGKAEMFTVQIKMPADYTVPPHHHPTDEKVSIVAGGPLAYGMGDKLDQASAGSLEKGWHITMQSGMNHWVVAPAGGATVQVTAMGPFQIVYADPKDDPRGAK